MISTAVSKRTSLLIDLFAISSFRDIADQDYIAARMACRANLVEPYLWSSQQAIEKYLKCILLLHRIPASRVKHDLRAALEKISSSGKIDLNLKAPTRQFIEYLDDFGCFRYQEISNHAYGGDIVTLDRAVWELRRYCSHISEHKDIALQQGVKAPKIRIPGGYLETVIGSNDSPAREPLLWQNGFFGKRTRKHVKIRNWASFTNSILYLHPEILDEILQYVHLQKDLVTGYRTHTGP